MIDAPIKNPDPLWVKETLVEDFVGAQEANGVPVPSARENEDVVLETLRNLDQRDAMAKPKPDTVAARDRRDAAARIADAGAKLIAPGEVEKMRAARLRDQAAVRVVATIRKQAELLRRRWKLLMQYPEWRKLALDAYCEANFLPENKGGGDKLLTKKVEALLERSNLTFGDWKKEPERKLHFT